MRVLLKCVREMEEFEDYYDILEVPSNASKDDIKRAYQALALKFHPDKQKVNANVNQGDRFAKISKAWQVLSDTDSRRKYDTQCSLKNLHQYDLVNEDVDLSGMAYNADMDAYIKSCRCGGEYIILKCDLQSPDCLVSCDTCSLCINVIVKDNQEPDATDVT